MKKITKLKILKLRITILDIQPKIWREILVENHITFERLHILIQILFGWTNSHLYSFNVDGKTFSVPYNELESNNFDSEIKVTKFLYEKGQTALYTYDFGDNWEHRIEIIDIGDDERNAQYAKCLAGERNSPPEDCGSIPGYEHIIMVLKNKGRNIDPELLEWLGDYDPEAFEIDEVNEAILDPDKYMIDLRDFLF